MMMLTCATLVAALAAASPGDVLTLAPGSDCPEVVVRNQQKAKPVTLVLDGATIRKLTFWDSSGFMVRGGTLRGPASGPSYAAHVRGARSSSIAFEGVTFTDALRGLVAHEASDLTISGNLFTGLRSDGMNLVSVQRVTVTGNRITTMNYTPKKCSLPDGRVELEVSQRYCTAKSGTWKDGHHPDGVQLWGSGIADVVIAGNRLEGAMQGIGFFGRTTPERPTRITIRDNVLRIDNSSWGISAQNITDLTLTGNDVDRVPGNPSKIKVLATGSTGLICGNKAPQMPRNAREVQRCPKAAAGPGS